MLTELLGFVPQLLLDDIADAATDTVNNAIDGLEVYLRNEWLPKRGQQPPPEELEAEVENGLLEFHTLLCGHRDMSIDMLETWSMRNVFCVPDQLGVVMPHHRGLDLTTVPGRDVQLQVELDVVRRKIENARTFQLQLEQAEYVSQRRLERSKARLDKIKQLQAADTDQVEHLAKKLRALFSTISSLPTTAPPLPSSLSSGKKHTDSRADFLEWAVKRLVTSSTSGPTGELGPLAKDIQDDHEEPDESRLVGPSTRFRSGSPVADPQEPPGATGQLSTIFETSFVDRASDGSLSQNVTGSFDSTLTEGASQTGTVKRRRSSVLGGSKRRRSSMGLSERAKAFSADLNIPGTEGAAGDDGEAGEE